MPERLEGETRVGHGAVGDGPFTRPAAVAAWRSESAATVSPATSDQE